MRHYARYRRTTNNKLTFFQKLLVFSDGKQAFKFRLVFYSASNSSVLRARSAILSIKVTCNNLTLGTAEQHMKTTLLCPTYSLQAVELIHGPDDIASV